MPAVPSYARIADQFLAEVPEFAEDVEVHLADNGELLQHVLFWDLTQFVLDAHHRGDDELVDRCLDFMARGLGSPDQDVRELITTSFVYNVGPWDPAVWSFIASWPEPLRAEAAKDGWRDTG